MKKLSLLMLVLAAFVTANAQPYLVGHRGSIWGVENTKDAFINGAKKGYHYLETDVKVTKDGYLVCWHDDNLTKASGQPAIADNTLSYLKSLKLTQTRDGVTYTGYLTTFEEYLDICKEYGVKPLVEFKWATGINNNDFSNIPKVVQLLEARGFRNDCYIFTSMEKCLQHVKSTYPDMEIMKLVYSESFESYRSWCITNKAHIGTGTGTEITKSGVQKYHDAGLLVNVWTCNSNSSYESYGNMGVDFITTDELDGHNLPTLSTPTTMLGGLKANKSEVSLVAGVGETVYADVTVTGTNMGSSVTATSSNSAFTVTNNTSLSSGTVSGTIRISYKPTTEGVSTGTITLKGTTKAGAEVTAKITVTGKCSLKFEEVWNYSETSGKAPATGTNWASDKTTMRNIAYGNGKIYVVNPGSTTITIANARTGEYIGSINTTGVSGGTYGVMDAEVVGGKLVACNLATSSNPVLKAYVWDTDNSEPREILNTENLGGCTRVGDTFDMKGDMTNGELLFLSGSTILKYTITNGTVSTTPTTISVTENGSAVDAGLSPRVIAQADGKYWITGNLIAPKLVSSTGAVEVTLDSDIFNDIEGNDFQPFTFKGKQYAFATTYAAGSSTVTGCRAVFIDASNGWNNAVNMGEYPAEGLGTTRNIDRSTSIEVAVDGTNGIEMWVNSVKQGIAYYKHGTPETETPEQPEQPETPEQPEQPETPSVNEPTLTQVWKNTGITTLSDCRQATGHNGTVYCLDRGVKQIVAVTNGSAQTYASNDLFAGCAITSDDKGNLLVSANASIWTANTYTEWCIVPANNPSNVTTLTVPTPAGFTAARVDEVGRVVGDMLSSGGAYVYLYANAENNAVLVKIANGQVVSTTLSSDVNADYAFTAATVLQPAYTTVSEIEGDSKAADAFYWRNRTNQSIMYLANGETKTYTPTSLNKNGDGFDVFTLGGVDYAICPANVDGTGTYGTGFSIEDLKNDTSVAKAELGYTTVSGKYYASYKAEKVSETKVNIYVYNHATVAAMYTFEIPGDLTAIESVDMEEVEAPVEYYNLQGVRVANPENGLFIKKQGNKVTKVIL